MSAKGKCTYPNIIPPPKNKSLLKKTFYYYLHTLNTQSMLHSVYLYHSVSLSPSSVSAFIFLTLIPNIPPRIISPIHCSGYTALTYLLTPQSTVLLEKLTSFQLVKKFPTFYGTRRFITTLRWFIPIVCAIIGITNDTR
jgi:hypothetical protein